MRGGFIICVMGGILAAIAAPEPARACSVPVFRYALERWGADRFEAIVFHSGKLTEAQEAVVGGLESAAESRGAMMNLSVKRALVREGSAENFGALWKEQVGVGATMPWVVIRYPATFTGEEKRVMWSGKLEAVEIQSLLQSPARVELARRLIEGEAIVWVLVESGSRVRDERVGKLLEEQIVVLEKTVKVSKVLEDDPEITGPALVSGLALKLKMSMIRIARGDEKEKLFVEMLKRTQTDSMAEDEPAVFAVFGRGRVLCAFAGREINGGNLEEAAKFLAGPCSCQVKELNPGVDLLMGADWNSVVEDRPAVAARVGRIEIPEPRIANGPTTRVSVAVTQASAQASNGYSKPFALILNDQEMLKIAAIGMGVVAVVLAFMLIRQRRAGR